MPKILFLLFILTSTQFSLFSKYFHAKVIKINDGDTITVLTNDNIKYKIRLYGIDCPEKDQAFGNKSKKFTSKLVFNSKVIIKQITVDRYKRTVALVYFDNICLNEILLTNGYAWVYRKYCKKPYINKWLKYENYAKSKNLGLWADNNPIPPWEYRKNPTNDLFDFLTENLEEKNILIILILLVVFLIIFTFLKKLKK
jgi:endonuclease YncB( thermonuclease family)